MFCPSCGSQIADGSAFCPACGKATNAAVQVVPVQPVQYGYIKPKIPGRGLGIAGMVLGIIGLVYCFAALVFTINLIQALDVIYKYGTSPSFGVGRLSPIIFASILSILAVSLAGAGRRKGYRTGVSTAGVVMGTIGLGLLAIALIIIATNT